MTQRTLARSRAALVRGLATGVLTLASTPIVAHAATVTIAPVHAAPALGKLALLGLISLLVSVAIFSLRRPLARGAALVLALGLSLGTATQSFAPVPQLTIDGDDCQHGVTFEYDADTFPTAVVHSECGNLVQIVGFDFTGCGDAEILEGKPRTGGPPTCSVGMVLSTYDSCRLPSCDS